MCSGEIKFDEKKFTREIKSIIRLADKSLPTGGKSAGLDDLLTYLRTVIKYLVFDLEATKRELKIALKRGR